MGTYVDIHEPLIRRCRQGDCRAQAELYRLYAKAMYHVALRITRNEMEAEDVLQEAFTRAFRHLRHFKGESTFGAWFKRIVINTSINHIKRQKGWEVALEDHHSQVPAPTVETAEPPMDMKRIQRAITSLPEGYREVFRLYQLEGYDHAEIGSILGISEATSKSQYSRARKKLRQMLHQQLQHKAHSIMAMSA